VLLVLSGDDFTAKEFVEYTDTAAEWRGLTQRQLVSRHDESGADHTYSNVQHRHNLEQVTLLWLAGVPP